MTKDNERKLVDEAYGPWTDCVAIASESPDFLCKQGDQVVLGIEVTEYFHTESDARLKRIPGYVAELCLAKSYRHKIDKTQVRVEKIKYLPGGDKNKAIEVMAIVKTPPDLMERSERLNEIVASKSQKFPAYVKHAPVIDLIIDDVDHNFAFQQFSELYPGVAGPVLRKQLITTPFREVFLRTKRVKSRVCVPLRQTIFVAEVARFERCFKAARCPMKTKSDMITRFAAMIQYLAKQGFGRALVAVLPNEVQLHFAAGQIAYTQSGMQVRCFVVGPNPSGDYVDALAKDEAEPGCLKEIEKLAADDLACFDLSFPTYTVG